MQTKLIETKLIELTREDKIVAGLNKWLLKIQAAKHLMAGASLFRPQGPLFEQSSQSSQSSTQVQGNLFEDLVD